MDCYDVERLHTSSKMYGSGFIMLSRKLYSLFIAYIECGKVRAPPAKDLEELTPTFQSGAKTDRRALQSKFKSWAKRMALLDDKLVLVMTGKIILPKEDCENIVKELHFSNSEEHLNMDDIALEIQKTYTWNRKNFGMDWPILATILRNVCSNKSCMESIEGRLYKSAIVAPISTMANMSLHSLLTDPGLNFSPNDDDYDPFAEYLYPKLGGTSYTYSKLDRESNSSPKQGRNNNREETAKFLKNLNLVDIRETLGTSGNSSSKESSTSTNDATSTYQPQKLNLCFLDVSKYSKESYSNILKKPAKEDVSKNLFAVNDDGKLVLNPQITPHGRSSLNPYMWQAQTIQYDLKNERARQNLFQIGCLPSTAYPQLSASSSSYVGLSQAPFSLIPPSVQYKLPSLSGYMEDSLHKIPQSMERKPSDPEFILPHRVEWCVSQNQASPVVIGQSHQLPIKKRIPTEYNQVETKESFGKRKSLGSPEVLQPTKKIWRPDPESMDNQKDSNNFADSIKLEPDDQKPVMGEGCVLYQVLTSPLVPLPSSTSESWNTERMIADSKRNMAPVTMRHSRLLAPKPEIGKLLTATNKSNQFKNESLTASGKSAKEDATRNFFKNGENLYQRMETLKKLVKKMEPYMTLALTASGKDTKWADILDTQLEIAQQLVQEIKQHLREIQSSV